MAAEKKFMTQVINLYRELPCLWRVADPNYRDKCKKNHALDELVELFREHDPAASRDSVQKKINGMRGSFRKERNKVQASVRAGVKLEEMHVPKLWYYNLLHFLEDQEVPRQLCSAQSTIDDGDDENSFEECLLDIKAPVSRQSTPSPPPRSCKRPGSKPDRAEKISKRLDQPTPSVANQKQQHDAFGEHIAEKMRSLPPRMVSICQKLINDAIFLAEVNALNMSSRIISDEQPTSNISTRILKTDQ